jgi:hypothetical protein
MNVPEGGVPPSEAPAVPAPRGLWQRLRLPVVLMPQNRGILITILAGIVGAAATYGFQTMRDRDLEVRERRAGAILDYLRARQSGTPEERIYTRNLVLTFAGADVVHAVAEAQRESARTAGEQCAVPDDPDAKTTLDVYVEEIQAIRATYTDDPLPERDVLALLCPFPCEPCYGVHYSLHLER